MSFLDLRTRGDTRLPCELRQCDSVDPKGQTNTYPPTDPWGGVNHVDAGGAGENLPVADNVRHVDMAINAALLELHVVLSESPSLVCEDVLDLRT